MFILNIFNLYFERYYFLILGINYELSIEIECEFLDAGLYIQSSLIDAIHLDSYSCFIIGNRIVEKVIREIYCNIILFIILFI